MTDYFSLIKPRMSASNAAVAAAAFVFGSPAAFDWAAFLMLMAGFFLVVGSACAFNNWYDRSIDARMERTKNRALPSGRVAPHFALFISFALLPPGAALLAGVNLLALGTALLGWIVYSLLYTPLKHFHSSALYVGAVAGALPPVAGYAAASGRLDAAALGLFVFMFLWQLPHFMAIAIYRFDEYAAAGVPLLLHAPPGERSRRIARTVFYISLVVLAVFCLALILQRWTR
jgi:protoheme IX farnesyltransferase